MTSAKETSLAPMYFPSTIFEEMERRLNERSWDRGRSWLPSMTKTSHSIPVIDVREEWARYVVTAELPGMTKEGVSIDVGRRTLDITAKKETESEGHDQGQVHKEGGPRPFHRRLARPYDVNPEGVEAQMKDGGLEIVLPKVVTESRKKVDVGWSTLKPIM